MRFYDSRLDIPVPTVTGLAVRRDGGLGAMVFAAGAGLNGREAMRAALSEVASYVPDFPERVTNELDKARTMLHDYSRVHELGDHALLYGLPEMTRHVDFLLKPRQRRDVEEVYGAWEKDRPRTLDLVDDLKYCLEQVYRLGQDVIVVNQTCPEELKVGVHTVRVIAPGLIPIDFGWERQRALDLDRTHTVLRKIGERDHDLSPEELNPHPHPFP